MLLLASAALLPLLSASDDARWYIPIFGLLILRTLDRSPGVRSALVWALTLATALALHAKGNFFIATSVVTVALLASDLYQRRISWTAVLIAAHTSCLKCSTREAVTNSRGPLRFFAKRSTRRRRRRPSSSTTASILGTQSSNLFGRTTRRAFPASQPAS